MTLRLEDRRKEMVTWSPWGRGADRQCNGEGPGKQQTFTLTERYNFLKINSNVTKIPASFKSGCC